MVSIFNLPSSAWRNIYLHMPHSFYRYITYVVKAWYTNENYIAKFKLKIKIDKYFYGCKEFAEKYSYALLFICFSYAFIFSNIKLVVGILQRKKFFFFPMLYRAMLKYTGQT